MNNLLKDTPMGSMISGPGKGMWHIGPSKIHGQGVLATRDLAPGSLIGVGIGFRLGFIPIITQDFGAWINHSYKPSACLMFFNGNYWIVATRSIPKGDEISVDYNKTPWYIKKPEPHWT